MQKTEWNNQSCCGISERAVVMVKQGIDRILLWDCFNSVRPGKLVGAHEMIDGDKCRAILKENLLEGGYDETGPEVHLLKEDNSKHIARLTTQSLRLMHTNVS